MTASDRYPSVLGRFRLPFLVTLLLCPTSNIASAAIESPPSSGSSSDYEHDYDNYQRRSLLPPTRNKNNQVSSKVSTSSTQNPNSKARNRRDQSKDLKRLIQELEESDYSNYGSWGNFRQRQQPVTKKSGTLHIVGLVLSSHLMFYKRCL